MKQTIEERVTQVVREVLDIDPGLNILDVSIGTELATTSLDQMTLFLALEDEFQRSIPSDELEGIDTIRDVVCYIERKLILSG